MLVLLLIYNTSFNYSKDNINNNFDHHELNLRSYNDVLSYNIKIFFDFVDELILCIDATNIDSYRIIIEKIKEKIAPGWIIDKEKVILDTLNELKKLKKDDEWAINECIEQYTNNMIKTLYINQDYHIELLYILNICMQDKNIECMQDKNINYNFFNELFEIEDLIDKYTRERILPPAMWDMYDDYQKILDSKLNTSSGDIDYKKNQIQNLQKKYEEISWEYWSQPKKQKIESLFEKHQERFICLCTNKNCQFGIQQQNNVINNKIFDEIQQKIIDLTITHYCSDIKNKFFNRNILIQYINTILKSNKQSIDLLLFCNRFINHPQIKTTIKTFFTEIFLSLDITKTSSLKCIKKLNYAINYYLQNDTNQFNDHNIKNNGLYKLLDKLRGVQLIDRACDLSSYIHNVTHNIITKKQLKDYVNYLEKIFFKMFKYVSYDKNFINIQLIKIDQLYVSNQTIDISNQLIEIFFEFLDSQLLPFNCSTLIDYSIFDKLENNEYIYFMPDIIYNKHALDSIDQKELESCILFALQNSDDVAQQINDIFKITIKTDNIDVLEYSGLDATKTIKTDNIDVLEYSGLDATKMFYYIKNIHKDFDNMNDVKFRNFLNKYKGLQLDKYRIILYKIVLKSLNIKSVLTTLKESLYEDVTKVSELYRINRQASDLCKDVTQVSDLYYACDQGNGFADFTKAHNLYKDVTQVSDLYEDITQEISNFNNIKYNEKCKTICKKLENLISPIINEKSTFPFIDKLKVFLLQLKDHTSTLYNIEELFFKIFINIYQYGHQYGHQYEYDQYDKIIKYINEDSNSNEDIVNVLGLTNDKNNNDYLELLKLQIICENIDVGFQNKSFNICNILNELDIESIHKINNPMNIAKNIPKIYSATDKKELQNILLQENYEPYLKQKDMLQKQRYNYIQSNDSAPNQNLVNFFSKNVPLYGFFEQLFKQLINICYTDDCKLTIWLELGQHSNYEFSRCNVDTLIKLIQTIHGTQPSDSSMKTLLTQIKNHISDYIFGDNKLKSTQFNNMKYKYSDQQIKDLCMDAFELALLTLLQVYQRDKEDPMICDIQSDTAYYCDLYHYNNNNKNNKQFDKFVFYHQFKPTYITQRNYLQKYENNDDYQKYIKENEQYNLNIIGHQFSMYLLSYFNTNNHTFKLYKQERGPLQKETNDLITLLNTSRFEIPNYRVQDNVKSMILTLPKIDQQYIDYKIPEFTHLYNQKMLSKSEQKSKIIIGYKIPKHDTNNIQILYANDCIGKYDQRILMDNLSTYKDKDDQTQTLSDILCVIVDNIYNDFLPDGYIIQNPEKLKLLLSTILQNDRIIKMLEKIKSDRQQLNLFLQMLDKTLKETKSYIDDNFQTAILEKGFNNTQQMIDQNDVNNIKQNDIDNIDQDDIAIFFNNDNTINKYIPKDETGLFLLVKDENLLQLIKDKNLLQLIKCCTNCANSFYLFIKKFFLDCTVNNNFETKQISKKLFKLEYIEKYNNMYEEVYTQNEKINKQSDIIDQHIHDLSIGLSNKITNFFLSSECSITQKDGTKLDLSFRKVLEYCTGFTTQQNVILPQTDILAFSNGSNNYSDDNCSAQIFNDNLKNYVKNDRNNENDYTEENLKTTYTTIDKINLLYVKNNKNHENIYQYVEPNTMGKNPIIKHDNKYINESVNTIIPVPDDIKNFKPQKSSNIQTNSQVNKKPYINTTKINNNVYFIVIPLIGLPVSTLFAVFTRVFHNKYLQPKKFSYCTRKLIYNTKHNTERNTERNTEHNTEHNI